MSDSPLAAQILDLAQNARAASLALATTPTAAKNAALAELAHLLETHADELLAANAHDLAATTENGLTPAQIDRLTLTPDRLAKLAQGVREVAALPDPVGETLDETTRPNGLHLRRVRVPIGVIAIVYEARPNVTIDCAVLCLKSGNAAILRGGKECFHTNTALAALITRALAASGLPPAAAQLIPTTDRAALTHLLRLDALVHCIIPRGGESLIRFVAENSTIPVIKHYNGICFVYVDAAADLPMAEQIIVNAKTSRPGVCNAAEQLLVHHAIAEKFLPRAAKALIKAANVELRCDAPSSEILTRAGLLHTAASKADYRTEFLSQTLAIRIVDSLDQAIATINRDSSGHTETIVTADEPTAQKFLAAVDSAAVLWNASTRFSDGYEFGLGAEIGISTDRLHARGPMGLRELCTYKWIGTGTGQSGQNTRANRSPLYPKKPRAMTLKKRFPSLLLALLAFGFTASVSALAQNDAEQTRSPARATRSEARENTTPPDAPPTSGAHKKGVFDPFDAFPATAAKRTINPRAVSENVAAQLAARMPHYTPPPKTDSDAGPTSPAQNEQVEDLVDLRNEDRPQNQILRLPDYVVREKKPPVFRERDIHSATGLAALATRRYLSETAQALNRYTLPLFGNGAQAYALARYEEDERLRTIRELTDTAHDLGLLQDAEITNAPVWGGSNANWGSAAPASRRSSTDAEANLRRLIRETTSHRATEPRSKLAQ